MDNDRDHHPRFYKSADRKFLGVAGGIADYFGWDPLLVRVAVLCGLFIPVPVVAVGYFALAFLAPHEYEVRNRRDDREAWRAANRDYWHNWARDNGLGTRRSRRAAARARGFQRQASRAASQAADAVNTAFAPGMAKAGGDTPPRDEADTSPASPKKGGAGASARPSLRVLVIRVKRRFADIDDRLQDLERAAVSGDVRLRKAFRDLEKPGPGDAV